MIGMRCCASYSFLSFVMNAICYDMLKSYLAVAQTLGHLQLSCTACANSCLSPVTLCTLVQEIAEGTNKIITRYSRWCLCLITLSKRLQDVAETTVNDLMNNYWPKGVVSCSWECNSLPVKMTLYSPCTLYTVHALPMYGLCRLQCNQHFIPYS